MKVRSSFFFFPYSRYVSQSAAREALGQNALKVCGPLNGKQEQLHLDLLSPRSHDFSKLHPWEKHTKHFVSIAFLSVFRARPETAFVVRNGSD